MREPFRSKIENRQLQTVSSDLPRWQNSYRMSLSVCVYVSMYPILTESTKFNITYDKTFRVTLLDPVLQFSHKRLPCFYTR